MRIEVWYDANNLRAFPNVKEKTIKNEDGFLTFKYGTYEGVVTVNLSKVFFLEIMKEN